MFKTVALVWLFSGLIALGMAILAMDKEARRRPCDLWDLLFSASVILGGPISLAISMLLVAAY